MQDKYSRYDLQINPPYFVPLVEVVPSQWTDPALVESARELMKSVGQVPVTVRKELPGFAVVRTQNAIIQQAMRLVIVSWCYIKNLTYFRQQFNTHFLH